MARAAADLPIALLLVGDYVAGTKKTFTNLVGVSRRSVCGITEINGRNGVWRRVR